MSNIIDIVEKHYELIRPFLTTEHKPVGRPRCNELSVLKAVLKVLKSGGRWKDLPQGYPSYQTCHRRFQQWVKVGVLDRVLRMLVQQAGADVSEVYIDGSFAPAKKGGLKVGKSIKGKGSRLMLLLSKNQKPISLQVESASPHEVTFVHSLIQNRLIGPIPKCIIGDKAYDSDPLDKTLQKIGIEMIAPNRECRKVKKQDKRKLRRMTRRWAIERYFSWLKSFRRIGVRWETKPQNYQGWIALACIVLILRGF